MRVFLASILCAASMFAQDTVKQAQKEHIQFGLLPGVAPWVEVTNKSGADASIREFIPEGQTLDDYRDMWTIQTFNKLKGKAPAEFIKDMFGGVSGACESVRVNGPKEQVEDTLHVAYAQIYCGKQKGKDYGVNIFIKVIAGREALYVIQREFHVPPSQKGGVMSFTKEQMKEAMALMKAQSEANDFLVNGVYICGPNSLNPHCKETVSSSPTTPVGIQSK